MTQMSLPMKQTQTRNRLVAAERRLGGGSMDGESGVRDANYYVWDG